MTRGAKMQTRTTTPTSATSTWRACSSRITSTTGSQYTAATAGTARAARCHSLAWPADPFDARARYAGSGLFHVALHDGLHRRGYVHAMPGAPMCACIEQMPTMSQAGCTQSGNCTAATTRFL